MENCPYKAIFKLKDMLEEAGYPYSFFDRSVYSSYPSQFGYDIPVYYFEIRIYNGVPKPEARIAELPEDDDLVMTITQGFSTIGGDWDLLEILGLVEDDEVQGNLKVLGYLTAENVFNRIERYFNEVYRMEK